MGRLFITKADVEKISGQSPKTCYKTIRKIREKFNKGKNDPITTYDLAIYLKMPHQELFEIINAPLKR